MNPYQVGDIFSPLPLGCIRNFIYLVCLRWCTTRFVWKACCLCPSTLSQVCLEWLLTSAVLCGRRELTGPCSASFVEKWRIGFQCGKDDGEGHKWQITAEFPEITALDEENRASKFVQHFQCDNVHKEWFYQSDVEGLDWPAQSPNLNLIQQTWDELEH